MYIASDSRLQKLRKNPKRLHIREGNEVIEWCLWNNLLNLQPICPAVSLSCKGCFLHTLERNHLTNSQNPWELIVKHNSTDKLYAIMMQGSRYSEKQRRRLKAKERVNEGNNKNPHSAPSNLNIISRCNLESFLQLLRTTRGTSISSKS